MNTEEFVLKQIGVVSSPHTDPSQTPIQPVFARGIKGTVTLAPQYRDGLRDLAGFSHLYVFYAFHRTEQTKLVVRPYLQDQDRGVFSTRAPCRPNKIGFSLVKLTSIEANVLHIEDVDMLDGTPVLDIKPYIARFDSRESVRSGWQDEVADEVAMSRGRRGVATEANKGKCSVGLTHLHDAGLQRSLRHSTR